MRSEALAVLLVNNFSSMIFTFGVFLNQYILEDTHIFTIIMFLRLVVVFLLFLPVELISLHNQRQETIEQVRNYLRRADITSRLAEITQWLENSNKIGLGYNILSGSPVCYTGKCQSTGFTRAIFKLNYTSAVPGSCTNKLVPNNVDLDCLPSTSLKIDSEVIDTVEKLHKSITDKVTVSVGARYMAAGFSYKYSKETQYMLDNIVQKQQISIVSARCIYGLLKKMTVFS